MVRMRHEIGSATNGSVAALAAPRILGLPISAGIDQHLHEIKKK
ncbi:MAG: hypothetical protein RL719_1050 [Actinomycetota bacterium]|jgi:hypothetical protein